MNISHRSLWNASLGAWVAVSENTCACGKRSGGARLTAVAGGVLALSLLLAPGVGFAQNYGATGGGPGGGAAGVPGNGAGGGVAGTLGLPNGGAGVNSVAGAYGGGGGYSHLATGDINSSRQGGTGGIGGTWVIFGGGSGGGGGAGGDGVRITAPGPALVSATVTGGNGGGGGGFANHGGSGGGGAGVVWLGNGSLTTSAQVTGGNGGGFFAGGSGGGGTGVILQLAGQLITSAGITGGNGAAGSTQIGNAGDGVLMVGAGSITTSATGVIAGGNATITGKGGNGVALLSGGTIVNAGTIRGGTGGNANSGPINSVSGGSGSGGASGWLANAFQSGANGAGITGAGISITNSGTIAGGTAGLNVANAITFTGGSNSLTLQTGSVLTGAIGINGGATASIVAGNTGLSFGNLVLGGNGIVDTSGNALTGSGVISGAGNLTKQGMGNLILTGTNTYTGTTNVNAGTLVVNGSLTSATTVNSGGSLGGNGTLGNTTIASGGVLAPGNSIGTLNVNGNLSFAAGSIYRVEVDAAGNNDRTNATGTATISGGTVDVQAGPGTYQASTQYTILNATGGRTGNFAGVTSNLAFLTPALSYDANNVFLTLTRNSISFSTVAITPNQVATSTALQNAGATGDIGTVQTALTGLSAVQARAAYDSASGAGIVALQRASAGFAGSFGNQLQARLGVQINAGSGLANSLASRPMLLAANDHVSSLLTPVSDTPQKLSLAGGTGLSASPDPAGKGFWLRGHGSEQRSRSDGNAAASQLRGSALSGGFDTQIGDRARAGVALSSGNARLSTDNNETGNTRSSAVALYGSYSAGPWSFSGSTSFAHSSNQMTRSVVVGTINRTANANFDSTTLSAYVEAAYAFAMKGGWTLQPLAGLSVSRSKSDAFTETGAGALNLQVASQRTDSNKSLLGVKAAFDIGRVSVQPRVIWAHELGNLNTPMTAQFQGAATASPFQISGVALKRDTLVLGLAAAGRVGHGLDLFADVQLEHNARQHNLAMLVGLRKNW